MNSINTVQVFEDIVSFNKSNQLEDVLTRVQSENKLLQAGVESVDALIASDKLSSEDVEGLVDRALDKECTYTEEEVLQGLYPIELPSGAIVEEDCGQETLLAFIKIRDVVSGLDGVRMLKVHGDEYTTHKDMFEVLKKLAESNKLTETEKKLCKKLASQLKLVFKIKEKTYFELVPYGC